MTRFSRKQLVAGAVLIVGLLGLAGGSAFWRQVSRVVEESESAVSSEAQIDIAVIRLDVGGAPGQPTTEPAGLAGAAWKSDLPAAAVPATENSLPLSPFDWLGTPSAYTDAAFLDDRLFLVGPAGIFEYSPAGSLLAQYLVGRELPPAPPLAVAAGLALRGPGRALYVATAGEGLLILERAASGSRLTVQQIRAEEPAFRDLTAILPLETGRVVLGSQHEGVLVYDGRRLTRFHGALAEGHVTALAGDESSLWVGTLASGLLHWQGGRVASFTEADGLPDPQVLSLARRGDSVYAGTPLGVTEFRAGRYQRNLAPGFFSNALLARRDELIVGTLDEGIAAIPLRESRTRGPRPEPNRQVGPGSAIQRLFEAQGEAYALARDGLYQLDEPGEDWRRVLGGEAGLLADRNVSALAADSAGRLWVGYFDRGLDVLETARGPAKHIEDQFVFCVNRIVHDAARGLTAVATANGLVMFDAAARRSQVLRREDGLIASHVTDVIFDDGGMTVATPAGITFLGPGGARSLYAFQGLVNNHVYALASSGETLLAGTLGGLSVLEAGVVRTSYTTGNSELQHNWITSIVPVGNEWFVGTYGAGVLQLDSMGRWRRLPEASGRFEVNPNAMVAGSSRVYAGTLGRGLLVYEKSLARWRRVTQGLPSLNVTALALVGNDLYVGTDNGLVRVQEEAL